MGNISNELFQMAKKCIPGGVNSPVRAGNAFGTEPPFIADTHGCIVRDANGNEYTDYVCSWSP